VYPLTKEGPIQAGQNWDVRKKDFKKPKSGQGVEKRSGPGGGREGISVKTNRSPGLVAEGVLALERPDEKNRNVENLTSSRGGYWPEIKQGGGPGEKERLTLFVGSERGECETNLNQKGERREGRTALRLPDRKKSQQWRRKTLGNPTENGKPSHISRRKRRRGVSKSRGVGGKNPIAEKPRSQ